VLKQLIQKLFNEHPTLIAMGTSIALVFVIATTLGLIDQTNAFALNDGNNALGQQRYGR
jgi:hypothetical protein